MILLDLFAFVVIFILGSITSYTDITKGKIKNVHLAISLIFLLIIISFKLLSGYGFQQLTFFTINLISAIVIAVGIWLLGFWTPGDAKLFFVFSIALSIIFPAKDIFELSSFLLLILVFVPLFVLLVFLSIFSLSISDIKKALRKSFDEKLLLAVLAVFVINYIFTVEPWKGVGIFIILLVTYLFFKKYSVYVLSGIAIARLAFDTSIYSVSFLYFFLILFFAVYLFRFFAGEVFYEVFTRKIKVGDLKPGMIPAEVIRKKDKVFVKDSLAGAEMYKGTRGVFEIRPEGLGKKDITKIRKTGIHDLKVFKTLPFAPFMFIGVFLFIIFSFI